MKISGQLVDIHLRDIYPAEIFISNGLIDRIERKTEAPADFILPGFIDAHIHIESSMITPGAFGMEAVRHGTIGVVCDPHEIANVLGWKGVQFMIDDAKKSPLYFWFGLPSCVPATAFETSGAAISARETEKRLKSPSIKFLSEMMNFPGVLMNDGEVIRKLEAAKRLGKPVDGHAPGLSGESLKKYIESGISTDHECSTLEEAREKIGLGMKVLIREGSAARNLDDLKPLFTMHPDKIMLCSDDLHPEMLEVRHIGSLAGKLIEEGYDKFDVIRSATVNPVKHYGLESGLLQKGGRADFIVVGNLGEMDVKETWIAGEKIFDRGKRNFTYTPGKPLNKFNCSPVSEDEIRAVNKGGKIRIIEAFDGQLLTGEIRISLPDGEYLEADPARDILKIVVKDRYGDSPPAIGFIKGFGLKRGAFASSIAHDSHNILSVGANDSDMVSAINEIVRCKGGLAVSDRSGLKSLQLNIGGIMTTASCHETASQYKVLNRLVSDLGCNLTAPFMTLSFMALLVIPSLKIGDRGLFDVNRFSPVSLYAEDE